LTITITSKETGNPSLKHPPPKKSRAMRSKKKTIIPPLKNPRAVRFEKKTISPFEKSKAVLFKKKKIPPLKNQNHVI